MGNHSRDRLGEGAGMSVGAAVGAAAGLALGNVAAGVVLGAGAGIGLVSLLAARPRRSEERPRVVSPGQPKERDYRLDLPMQE